MSESHLDEEFELILQDIFELKEDLTDDEQNFIDAWVSKLKLIEEDEGKRIRREYIVQLKSQLERDPRKLSAPFTSMPPDSDLPPIRELMPAALQTKRQSKSVPERSRYLQSTGEKKQPCCPKEGTVKKPERLMRKIMRNEFENPEGMAISIARSKGMMLAEFVADISRHTSDKGQELRTAMKSETSSFSEYVEKVITQRIKDVGELLDDKQAREMMKIRKDFDKWQAELFICKKRLKELVPEFDIDAYRNDKNYFKKIFSVDSSNQPHEDKFKDWKEENCHRLMWFMNENEKLTEENNRVTKEILAIKSKATELRWKESEKQKCYSEQIEIESEKNKQLKQKRDKIAWEIAQLLVSLEN